MTTVVHEILAWSAARPAWQRDALRRMVSTTAIADRDHDELLRLCKKPHGLLVDGDDIVAVASVAEHLPVAVQDGSPVSLTAVEETAHVNALAPGQRLEFAAAGLTIV